MGELFKNCKKFIKPALLVTLLYLIAAFTIPSFKDTQMQYARVKSAYKKWEQLNAQLKSKGIEGNFELHIRHFKLEKELELWARKKGTKSFSLIKTFPVCAASGELGPKRKEGDYQVPEGFYEISWFNPVSDYHLGLKVNYPNKSDKIKSAGKRTGGDIMIHGNCVTIGCIPLQDDPIEEFYVYCVESKNYNNPIYLSMFPCKFTVSNEALLAKSENAEHKKLWNTLKTAYAFFEKNKYPAPYTINAQGDYILQSDVK